MTTDLSPGPGPAPSAVRGRAAVPAVAAATFTVVTSEMMPVGLLSPLAEGLGVSESAAGLAVTLPAVVAAFAAPLLPAVVRRADRRTLLCALMLLLAAANAVSALAPGLGVLLAARVVVGVCVGGVWALAAGLAHRLVPSDAVGRATALIFGGIGAASVAGVPAGALIGELAGWRWGFAASSALALAVAGALATLLPPLPALAPTRPREMAALLRLPAVRTGLLVVALLVTGHFAAYTYVRPALERVDGIPAAAISGLLLVYGVAGIAGNFLAGARAARSPRRVLLALSTGLAGAALLLATAARSPWPAVMTLVLWGLAYGGVSVAAQNWMLRAAPHATEAASGLFTGLFNASIALGAASGAAVTAFAAPAPLLLGAVLAALVVLLLTRVGEPGEPGAPGAVGGRA